MIEAGDLVTHIDRKDFGVVTYTLKLRGKNRVVRVLWSDGEAKEYQSDYYLKGAVCKQVIWYSGKERGMEKRGME